MNLRFLSAHGSCHGFGWRTKSLQAERRSPLRTSGNHLPSLRPSCRRCNTEHTKLWGKVEYRWGSYRGHCSNLKTSCRSSAEKKPRSITAPSNILTSQAKARWIDCEMKHSPFLRNLGYNLSTCDWSLEITLSAPYGDWTKAQSSLLTLGTIKFPLGDANLL